MAYTRKEFIKTSALLVATAVTGSAFTVKKKKKPLLAFSTIGCPDWTLRQVVDFAALHGYKAVEMRGLNGELDLPKCKQFSTPESIREAISMFKEKDIKLTGLGSSAKMHFPEGEQREKNLAEVRAYIDLAQKLNCPYVRVFPNEFPKNQDRNKTMEIVSNTLLELADYARDRNVTILMETHGDFSRVDDIEKVMRDAAHPNVGLVWDVSNMWTVTKESPREVYSKLKKYIRHTHLKDAKLVGGKPQYVLLGQGDVPVFEAIDILSNDGYKGYYSFEWEKLWHKELAEPEIALADFPRAMKEHFSVRR